MGKKCDFKNMCISVPKRRHIITKVNTSIDRHTAQLFERQIFDICPWKIFTPLQNFPYHYQIEIFCPIDRNGKENFEGV